jgi:EmrB/QacA subfamily drug resistance transporter
MRRYLIFLAVILTLLTASLSGTAIAVAFPQIISSFNTSLIVAGWVLSVNSLASTTAMPLVGKIGEAYGAKKTFLVCICLFTVASLLCSLAPNIELLILFRFLQGFGMGGFLPVGTAIIAKAFPNSRQQAIGTMSAAFAIGQIVGPNLGGWFTTAFGWQSTFWIFVPFGLVSLVIVLLIVPKTGGDSSKLDFVGAGILSAILASLLFGISLIGNSREGISLIQAGLFFILVIILGIIFIRRQTRIKNPIIDVEVLQEKRFLAANVYNMVLGFGMFGLTSFIPLYAVSVFGMSTFDSGFVMTPRSIGVMITSVVSSAFLLKWGYRKPMITGTILTAVSLMLMAVITPEILSGWQISIFLFISLVLLLNGVALGLTNPAANNACIELMPERVSTITGVRGMFRNIGAAVGISLATIALHNTDTAQHGFLIVMGGTGILLLLCIPVILLIPKNASVGCITKDKKTG